MIRPTDQLKRLINLWLGFMTALVVLAPTPGSAQQLAKMPFAADCFLLQNNSAALWSKGLPSDAVADIAKATEDEMKTYREGKGQHASSAIKAEIQRLLIEGERPDLPSQSRDMNQKALASLDTVLCWQDYAARRDHSFPSAQRMQFLADLRAKAAQQIADAARREASKPDDAKTLGHGARGN